LDVEIQCSIEQRTDSWQRSNSIKLGTNKDESDALPAIHRQSKLIDHHFGGFESQQLK